MDRTTSEMVDLVSNVHAGLPHPLPLGKCSQILGDYLYFHYGCDGVDDRGWGCGYRTIQSVASWLCSRDGAASQKNQVSPAPSLPHIQQALVTMGDKPGSFRGSRGWVGSFEASLVLDFFYGVPCKVVHVRGGELQRVAVPELHEHFDTRGSPVMMGGDRDNSSKCVVGVCTGEEDSYVLVVDPHYYGPKPDRAELQRRGWVGWRKLSSLDQTSFYNMCLPQTADVNTD
ncbi:ufm1-specific protease 1 [Gouania willdenowi]|uniref:ufm1-specific protease 1 n=1 Tax=Gouania willdenowi TaxID=441366 RepID=UPI00105659DA|nr:inactive Ufm1-specific protease 1 [Gouania willdenowi]